MRFALSRSAFARTALAVAAAVVSTPRLAFAAEGGSTDLLTPSGGLMVWTLVIFVLLLVALKKFAFGPLFAAVEARESALTEAIEGAKRDREEAQQILAEQQAKLAGARDEAQQIIADGRAVAEKMRAELLEQTKQQQQEMLQQARREIDGEKANAIAALRREAIDLAIAGAGKVVSQNLDSAGNRQLVEQFLASLDTPART